MHPFLSVFGVTIPSYGALLLAGLLAGLLAAVLFCVLRARARGLFLRSLWLLILYVLFFGFLGAKLLYFAVQGKALPALFASSPWELLLSGFVFYGGVLGGAFGVCLASRLHGVPLAPYEPLLVPALPLAHAFGRVGCFLAGCCYGIPMVGPLGIAFPSPIGGAPAGVPLFPVQLLEAGLDLLLFLCLWAYARRPRRPGSVLWLYINCYTSIRFCLEYLRFDAGRGRLGPFSTSQWLSLLLLILCTLSPLLIKKKRQRQVS